MRAFKQSARARVRAFKQSARALMRAFKQSARARVRAFKQSVRARVRASLPGLRQLSPAPRGCAARSQARELARQSLLLPRAGRAPVHQRLDVADRDCSGPRARGT